MEKGALNIFKSKKGKLITEILFEDGKKMPAPQGIKIYDESLNGKVIEVERVEGQIEKIVCEGEVIYSKAGKKQPIHRDEKPQIEEMITQHIDNLTDPAKAPYNFVPLNQRVVEAERIPAFNAYHKDRYTGWIDLHIETKTPLYIRDTLNQEEIKEQEESERFINSDFFSPGGNYKIPGSSIRGMIRTLVEITSYGKFGSFDNRNLYFRGLADRSNLRKEYQSKMSSFNKEQKRMQYKMNAGFIYKDGFKYFIKPAAGFKQILKKEAVKKIQEAGMVYENFQFYKLNKEYIVVSGGMPNKKREWVIYPSVSNDEIPVPEIDIGNYKNDANRSEQVPDLIERAKIEEVPCFYVVWTDKLGRDRVSFGHTGMFRLSYNLSIKEHIPESLIAKGCKLTKDRANWIEEDGIPDSVINKIKTLGTNEFVLDNYARKIDAILKNFNYPDDYKKVILKHTYISDIAEAIFGNEFLFAGRIYFEDAVLAPGQDNIMMEESIPKVLSSPKPTTFQHYLVQKSDKINNLAHYNSSTAIRGNKLYWHKSGDNWQEIDNDKIKKNEKIFTRIKPVNPETKFTSKVRFENLSKVELGALLFSLDLPEGSFHKLGMGKPLGLGSIEITPELYISNREKRYKKLFFEWNNETLQSNPSDFKTSFESYILENIGESEQEILWNTDRLRELKVMLAYKTGIELESQGETRYLELNEFKSRPILPKPTKVIPRKQSKIDTGNVYITKIDLVNIRCFEKLSLNLEENKYPILWTMILGNNSTGKTTLMRSIALGLCNESDAVALMKESNTSFIRDGKEEGEIKITLKGEKSKRVFTIKTNITRSFPGEPEIVRQTLQDVSWEDIFVCGYGPQRSNMSDASYKNYSSKDAVMPLFDYMFHLQNPELILRRQNEIDREKILEKVNQVLMSDNTEQEIVLTDKGLTLKTLTGIFPLGAVGDGYSSTTQWLIDFIGWSIYAENKDFGGILLIDELEQHLHPKWQRHIVERLRQQFPKIQFITTTHSPLIASSFGQLPTKKYRDKLIHLELTDSTIKTNELDITMGLTIDQTLASQAFDYLIDADPEVERVLAEASELVSKGNKRNDEENRRYSDIKQALKKIFQHTGRTLIERDIGEELYQEMKQHIKKLEMKLFGDEDDKDK
ncbi:MAG TPA: TIGR03986 family CRISPR-associated RAMP protein [Nitrospirae bacterium]|nr:recombination protein F [bacterium BMS3Abin06]HDH12015.1 TIGR03986 family CRISPR-associated RAMP protein [Nitrospirota bacterium]HDZ00835.1 TIGR03986 family CRISPR-associated RAMP protein [Nitrospirota bacterium]